MQFVPVLDGVRLVELFENIPFSVKNLIKTVMSKFKKKKKNKKGMQAYFSSR